MFFFPEMAIWMLRFNMGPFSRLFYFLLLLNFLKMCHEIQSSCNVASLMFFSQPFSTWGFFRFILFLLNHINVLLNIFIFACSVPQLNDYTEIF